MKAVGVVNPFAARLMTVERQSSSYESCKLSYCFAIPAYPSWYYYAGQGHSASCSQHQSEGPAFEKVIEEPTSQEGDQGSIVDQLPSHSDSDDRNRRKRKLLCMTAGTDEMKSRCYVQTSDSVSVLGAEGLCKLPQSRSQRSAHNVGCEGR